MKYREKLLLNLLEQLEYAAFVDAPVEIEQLENKILKFLEPPVTIKDLSLALLRSWGPDTAQGNWKADMPALNQCAVTALVVQDYLGGELLRQELNDGISHYWNRLPCGQELDLTFMQFTITKQYGIGEIVVRDREYVLSFPETLKRYNILKERVRLHLEVKND
jgi:hypothetical protein